MSAIVEGCKNDCFLSLIILVAAGSVAVGRRFSARWLQLPHTPLPVAFLWMKGPGSPGLRVLSFKINNYHGRNLELLPCTVTDL